MGVSAGEGRHPALQPAGVIFTRIQLLEWQCTPPCRKCIFGGLRHRTIPRPCSWFLSGIKYPVSEQSWRLGRCGRFRVNGVRA
jgi:hypothetical protein